MAFGSKFGREGAFGEHGEMIGRRWLKELGFFVLAASQIENGGTPLLESAIEKVILPDVFAWKGPIKMAVDVKSKRAPDPSKKRGRIESGIELRHFENYCRIQQVTETPCAILFIHADRTEGLLGLINDIRGDAAIWRQPADWSVTHPGHNFKEDMIFFNIDPNHGSRFQVIRIKADIEEWRNFQQSKIAPKTMRPWKKPPPEKPSGQKFFPGW